MNRRADPPPDGSRVTSVAARRPTWLLLVVALGVFVAADDQTSMVALLPAVIREVGISVDDFYRSAWVINGYLLGYLVALPLTGRIADVYGRGRVFVAALAVFIVGSVLVALAPTFEWLVVARAIQAVGGGGVVPVAMAIVVDELPPARRTLGLSAIAAAAEAGVLIGPLWGGAITEWLGWRWVFWVNVPMTVPLVFAGWLLAERSRRAGGAAPAARVDWRGGALVGIALGLLTYALTDDPLARRPAVVTFALLLASAGCAGVFAWHSLYSSSAMVRLAMFRPRPVWVASLVTFLGGGGLIAALIGVPLFVNLVLAESALDGGLALVRLTVAVPLGALAGGWLAGRVGLRPTAVAGLLLTAVMFVGLARWDHDLTEALRTIPQLIGGFGFGLIIAPLGAAVLQQVPESERATASAWLTMWRVSGMLVGSALLTSHGLGRFYARIASVEFGSPEFERLIWEAQLSTFSEVFIAAAVVMLLAALVALLIGAGRGGGDEAWWTLG